MKRTLLSALLCLSLLCTAAIPAFAAESTDDGLMTRAELVVLLHKSAGKPVVNYAMNYTDVSGGADYAEAVRWASSEKLANGYEDGTFRPDAPITREQLAVILYRCAQAKGQGFTGAWAFLLPYADAAQIHDYAYEAVCWMTMHQIMGTGESFAPDASVSDTDGAQIFAQFLTAVEPANADPVLAVCTGV